jgi:hypothetical protein
MNRLFLALLLMVCAAASTAAQPSKIPRHPRLVISPIEVEQLRKEKERYPLFAAAFHEAEAVVGAALQHGIDVPVPKDAAGYTHERHKQNYREMQLAGMLYQLTADTKYAQFVRDMLIRYAALYPTLAIHPAAVNKSGGRLFWQTLNESVWLVNTSMAYDLVYEWLSTTDRTTIEEGVLRPMAKFFIENCASTVDRIHNHATWMTAGIGMLGYVLDDSRLIGIALNGTKQDGKSGFLRQMDLLFSPDGYYSEGPYYSRYAIYPFFVFAESIERNQPNLRIYQRRNGILGKVLHAILQLTTQEGDIILVNDAMQKSILAQELILAVDYTVARYGDQLSLLSIASEQKKVTLDPAGFAVAKKLSADTPSGYVYRSVELSDGPAGDEGGIAVLRSGAKNAQSMLVMKYTAQGGGHGHFDRLNLLFFDEGQSVLTDYGAARFVNVEPKYGGRYLKENETWASQTLAHNTIVVDGVSHYGAVSSVGERNPGRRRFFSVSDPNLQVVSASAVEVAPGVAIERTVALVNDSALTKPLVLDVVRVSSDVLHQYDLPFHYQGQFITTNVRYRASDSLQTPLGTRNGYQHLWKTAEGPSDSSIVFTWLLGGRYYSVASAAFPKTEIIFARTGATDPNFNLRSEPSFILRRTASSTIFANVLQPHGSFEPINELSSGYRPPFDRIEVLASSSEATVVECKGESGLRWIFAVAHGIVDERAEHTIQVNGRPFSWKGNYSLVKQ